MSHESQVNHLLGMWRLDPTDQAARQSYGDVTLKFGADGTLQYTIHQTDKDIVMNLTFRVEDSFIVTDQPSQPRLEKTPYELTADGKLVLAFGGQRSRYVRGAGMIADC